ncbi:MAG: galactokinase [Bacteroidaceae bacterium]|nr:galactokinase [Bacteroidaceae bacterium]
MQYHIFSPYRICTVGAHSDHQHGLISGFALDKGIDLWFDITADGTVDLESRTFDGKISFNIQEETLIKQGNWGDYARGAKYALRKKFELKHGIRGVLQGSMPVGGLSSSAAVLIAYVMAYAKANDITLTPFEVAQTASVAEREYIGLNNGIMDQACIALGKKDHLLMFDCDSNDYRLIPFGGRKSDKGGLPFKLAVFFSGLTRSLVNSDFNLRVQECKVAAWNIMAYDDAPIKSFDRTFMRDVPREKYLKYKDQMPARFARRAEHFFSEYKRVREAVTAWENGDLTWFGRLSFESCESSLHNWECGSPELNAIYQAMRKTDGVYGGRFSGAGFKGACIAIIDPSKADNIEKAIREEYLAQYPQYEKTYQTFICESSDGARFVESD